MTAWDDDDWTGRSARGTHLAAIGRKPELLAEAGAPASITGAGIGIALIILLIVILT